MDILALAAEVRSHRAADRDMQLLIGRGKAGSRVRSPGVAHVNKPLRTSCDSSGRARIVEARRCFERSDTRKGSANVLYLHESG
jgi:hypothetical protein